MVLVLGKSEVSSFSLRDIMSMIKFLFYFQVQMYFLITNCFMFVWEISSIHRQTTRYMYHNYNKALVCKISDTLLNMVRWNTYFTLNIICLQALVEIKRIEKRKKILVMENLFPRKISKLQIDFSFFLWINLIWIFSCLSSIFLDSVNQPTRTRNLCTNIGCETTMHCFGACLNRPLIACLNSMSTNAACKEFNLLLGTSNS